MTKIAISFLNDLQDARYCAAMDCTYVGFCIDSSQSQYLSPTKIREIAAWLSGPAIFLACGADSIADLADLEKSLSFVAIKVEEKDWALFQEKKKYPIYLSASKNTSIEKLQILIAQVQAHHSDSKVIIKVDSEKEALNFLAFSSQIFLHFSTLVSAKHFLKEDTNGSFFGIYIEEEGYLAAGGLNYEALDELLA